MVHTLSSSMSEISACLIRIPTELLKQRAQAGQHSGSTLLAFKDVLSRAKGSKLTAAREMYTGTLITIARDVPFTVLQFTMWEAMKAGWLRHLSKSQDPSSSAEPPRITTTSAAVFGSISGSIAGALTTPLDVIKTRTMLARQDASPSHGRISPISMAGKIYREEGPKAFMKGVGPRVAWIGIGGAVFLGGYQAAWNAFGGEQGDGAGEKAVEVEGGVVV